MNVRLITEEIWPTLTTAAKRTHRPSAVAVAYFGQGAARLLPLRAGSRLVVDASEAAVKSGQTCPEELRKLIKLGVRVFSVPNLHAKTFVLGSTAFIGSANASRHSAGTLIEAMVATTDPDVVSDARRFVRDLCLDELGPEALLRLAKMYRPPRFSGARGQRPRVTKQRVRPELPRVLLAQLRSAAPPEGSEATQESGREVAVSRQEHPRKFRVDDFWWLGDCPYLDGDTVVQVVDEGEGRVLVAPPGKVIHRRVWKEGPRKVTFVYLELPKKRRVALKKLAARVGDDAAKRLGRGGLVSRQFAERLLRAWNL